MCLLVLRWDHEHVPPTSSSSPAWLKSRRFSQGLQRLWDSLEFQKNFKIEWLVGMDHYRESKRKQIELYLPSWPKLFCGCSWPCVQPQPPLPLEYVVPAPRGPQHHDRCTWSRCDTLQCLSSPVKTLIWWKSLEVTSEQHLYGHTPNLNTVLFSPTHSHLVYHKVTHVPITTSLVGSWFHILHFARQFDLGWCIESCEDAGTCNHGHCWLDLGNWFRLTTTFDPKTSFGSWVIVRLISQCTLSTAK